MVPSIIYQSVEIKTTKMEHAVALTGSLELLAAIRMGYQQVGISMPVPEDNGDLTGLKEQFVQDCKDGLGEDSNLFRVTKDYIGNVIIRAEDMKDLLDFPLTDRGL